MNDRDILRHDRLDRVSTFGSDNHADLPAGCEAIPRFANLATLSAKLGRHKVSQLRSPTSRQGLESTESISVLLLEATQEVTRLDAMMQNLYRRHPAKLHAWLAASRVERSPQRNKDNGNPTVATTPDT